MINCFLENHNHRCNLFRQNISHYFGKGCYDPLVIPERLIEHIYVIIFRYYPNFFLLYQKKSNRIIEI